MMVHLAVLIIASTGETAPPQAEYIAPSTDAASFSPLPEMWGLRELAASTRLDELDASFVLYLPQRARFVGGGEQGWVYFADGRQLVVKGELTEAGIADRLRSHMSICGIEYESDAATSDVQTAAAAYRLAGPPLVATTPSGVTRVEFRFDENGQVGRTRIRRLVCCSSADTTLQSIRRALPGFAKLTRKEHTGFVDPPMDDRPVRGHDVAGEEPGIALADEYFGRGYAHGHPLGLDAPEPAETARPGLLTLFREFRTGRKLTIDYSDYYMPMDPYLGDLNRRNGIHFRDPGYWP